MKRLSLFVLTFLLLPSFSYALVEDGPHLWLSTDPNQFNEGGIGYMGYDPNAWFSESYVTQDNPFILFIYHSVRNAVTATDIQLLVVIHQGESGTVTIEGTTYSSFDLVTLPPEYGGGNHGIYDDPPGTHDGRYALIPLGFDLDQLTYSSVNITWEGFSEVHFDVISSNGFWNPPSHDVTATVPEAATLLLIGAGLLWLRGIRKTI
jgi:hypothetical protein